MLHQLVNANQDSEELETLEAFVALGGRRDKSGFVNAEIIKLVISDFGLSLEVAELLALLDDDQNGELDFEEFEQLFLQEDMHKWNRTAANASKQSASSSLLRATKSSESRRRMATIATPPRSASVQRTLRRPALTTSPWRGATPSPRPSGGGGTTTSLFESKFNSAAAAAALLTVPSQGGGAGSPISPRALLFDGDSTTTTSSTASAFSSFSAQAVNAMGQYFGIAADDDNNSAATPLFATPMPSPLPTSGASAGGSISVHVTPKKAPQPSSPFLATSSSPNKTPQPPVQPRPFSSTSSTGRARSAIRRRL
jgi:hypothetical protein